MNFPTPNPEAPNNAGWRRILQVMVLGTLCAMPYMIIRFALAGNCNIGSDSGAYTVTLSVKALGRFFNMAAGALTFVDSVAFFARPRLWFWVALTGLLSVPFLLWMATGVWRVWRSMKWRKVLTALLIGAGAMTLPNVLTTVGEMHAYLLLFWIAMTIGLIVAAGATSLSRRLALVLVTTVTAASAVTAGHKWICMAQLGRQTDIVNKAIMKAYEGQAAPDRVLIVKVMDGMPGYSLYRQPVAWSSYYGYAARALWDWRHPRLLEDIKVADMDDVAEALAQQDMAKYEWVWVVRADGTFTHFGAH